MYEKRFLRSGVGALLLLALSAAPLTAQTKGAIEIGVENGLAVSTTQDITDNGTVLSEGQTDVIVDFPLLFWHVGFFASDRISIEPGFGLSYSNYGGAEGGSYTIFNFSTDVLYNLPSNLFFHAGGLFTYSRVGFEGADSESAGQFNLGAGLGYRIRLIGDQVKFRIGARYYYSFENASDGLPSAHSFLATIGLSVFTK